MIDTGRDDVVVGSGGVEDTDRVFIWSIKGVVDDKIVFCDDRDWFVIDDGKPIEGLSICIGSIPGGGAIVIVVWFELAAVVIFLLIYSLWISELTMKYKPK